MKDTIRAGHTMGGKEITASEMRIWECALQGVDEQKLVEAFAGHFQHQEATPTLNSILRTINSPEGTVTQRIIAKCIKETGMSLEDLRGPSRVQPLTRHRQNLMVELYEKTNMSQPQVGRLFNRDHTTVFHAIKATELRAAQ